jgi:hypothetical protein
MQWIRIVSIIPAALAAFALFAPPAAHADPYKWCAIYGGEDGGGTNCGFVTIAQCRATLSGIGGNCELNPFYTGPQEPAERARKRNRG